MANRFWVGGTGTWNAANTTSWSTSTGGGGGASVPGTGDIAIFDASSGGGTVTVDSPNGAGVVTVQGITFGSFTGTLDFSVNDNDVTISQSLQGTGTGTRTFNMGDGTWTLTGASTNPLDMSTTTGLTFNANGSTLVFAGDPTTITMPQFGAALSYNAVTFNANLNRGAWVLQSAPVTFGALTIAAPNNISLPQTVTAGYTSLTITGGSLSNFVALMSSTQVNNVTLNDTNGGTYTLEYLVLRRITFSGATVTADNSINLGNNSGVTINAPTGGGGGLLRHPGMSGGMAA